MDCAATEWCNDQTMTNPSGRDRTSPDDDWPHFELLDVTRVPHGDLEAWLARSPRRSASPDGRRWVVARRRAGGKPGVFVTNQPPPVGSAGLESLDVVEEGAAGRVIFPPGVHVDAVETHDDATVTLSLSLDTKARAHLGIDRVTLRAATSRLMRLPEPWPAEQGKKTWGAFAALLVESGVAATQAQQVATTYLRSERDIAEAKAREAAAKVARAWQDARRRHRRTGLGPGGAALEAAATKLGLAGAALDAARIFARPALALVENPRGQVRAIGKTRVGGAPDLPPGSSWPSIDGELLSFVLQLRLDRLPALTYPRLPAHGLLSVFLGQNESTTNVEHCIVWSPALHLARLSRPRGAAFRDPCTGMLQAVAVATKPVTRLPRSGTAAFRALLEAYGQDEDAILTLSAALHGDLPRDVSFVGGWPAATDASKHAIAHARRTPDPPARRWDSLMTIASHRAARLELWDHGTLDVLIPREDLLTSPRWDRTYAEIETS